MDGLAVEESLFLGGGSTFKGDVVLVDAKVEGLLDASGSTFEGALDLNRLAVEQSLFLRGGSTFKSDVVLVGAKVGGNLDASGSTFHGTIDASGAVIDGDLLLGSSRRDRTRWEPAASLVLRNTSVGALQDRIDRGPDGELRDAWPEKLQLDGFAYRRLGGLGGAAESEMIDRPTSWYEAWLERDESFSTQPYRQLAGVFQEAGADDEARDILYALRERERAEAWSRGEYGRWFGLTALWAVVGYGIGTGFFRTLFWVGLLTLVGTLVLWSGSAGPRGEGHRLWAGPRRKGIGWCAWASFDEILPLVELDKAHAEVVNERLSGWRLRYFYLHRIAAYVLGSFVVAGLAGLTQGS